MTTCSDAPQLLLQPPPGIIEEEWGGPEMWFKHPVFAHYWHHYKEIMNRAKATQQPVTTCHGPQVTTFLLKELHHQRQHYLQAYTVFNNQANTLRDSLGRLREQRAERRRRKRRNKRRTRAHIRQAADELEECKQEVDNDCTDEDDAEDEQLIEFFRQTASHQAARDASKVADGEFRDVSAAPEVISCANERAPTEQPGSRRREELRILYGSGADLLTVFGTETAMQLNFDSLCDRGGAERPQLWPVMPLRPMFADKVTKSNSTTRSWLDRVVWQPPLL